MSHLQTETLTFPGTDLSANVPGANVRQMANPYQWLYERMLQGFMPFLFPSLQDAEGAAKGASSGNILQGLPANDPTQQDMIMEILKQMFQPVPPANTPVAPVRKARSA